MERHEREIDAEQQQEHAAAQAAIAAQTAAVLAAEKAEKEAMQRKLAETEAAEKLQAARVAASQ